MKFVLGALAALSLLAGVSVSQPASAQQRCFWNGYSWQCSSRHFGWHRNWGWHRGSHRWNRDWR